jgi:uncharacterized RDD family membrane protein YckC
MSTRDSVAAAPDGPPEPATGSLTGVIGDEILTGEGVALQVSAASVIARAGAWLIDAFLTGVGLLGAFWLLGWVGLDRFDEASGTAMIYVLLLTFFFILPVTVETVSRGRSLGKLALGLQVIRDDGGPVRVRHAAVRALVGCFELWLLFGGLAFVVSMLNDRGKRVGDFLAGTYVARMRGVRPTLLPLYQPPELAGWAALTDIRPLPVPGARPPVPAGGAVPPRAADRGPGGAVRAARPAAGHARRAVHRRGAGRAPAAGASRARARPSGHAGATRRDRNPALRGHRPRVLRPGASRRRAERGARR